MARRAGNIFLTGISGSGKTSVGARLARILNTEFYDTDAEIESNLGISVADMFFKHGERYFRNVERTMLKTLIKSNSTDSARGRVIALGGGTLVSAESRKLVKANGELVYLKISCSVAAARLSHSRNRPLLMSRSSQPLSHTAITRRLRDQLRARARHYKEAVISVSSSQQSTQEIAREIIRRLEIVRKH